jgi:hypothetical protein
MQPQVISNYSDIATTVSLNYEGAGLFGTFFSLLMDKVGGSSAMFSLEGFLELLNSIWIIYVILAYIACILMLMLYVYASTGKKHLEDAENETRLRKERLYEEMFKGGSKNSRIEDMFNHVSSDNPNDWKLAIIEADIILDESLKEAGYGGTSLGERLRSISPTQLESLDDAWQAHKVRNQIAHGGADFILTHKLAQDTIKQYRIVFHELGVR